MSPRLEDKARAYWTKHYMLGCRRITAYKRDIYRAGLLRRFIGVAVPA